MSGLRMSAFSVASRYATRSNSVLLVLLLGAAFAPTGKLLARTVEPAPPEPTKPGDPNAPRVSADRSGYLPTRDGLTLHLTTDLGSVKIISLEPGTAPVIRYTVHLETDARGVLAQRLLDRYSLIAKANP